MQWPACVHQFKHVCKKLIQQKMRHEEILAAITPDQIQIDKRPIPKI